MAIYDSLTGLAHFEVVLLAKNLPGHNGSALGVEDLATGTAMMLASEGCEGITTVEACFSIFVSHPKLSIQDLSPHLGESAFRHGVYSGCGLSLSLNFFNGRNRRSPYSGGCDDRA
jgi:hypothetical protein